MDGKLNMRLILEKFIVTYTDICGPLVDRFKEKDGSGKSAPENFYHGLVIGLLVELRGRYESELLNAGYDKDKIKKFAFAFEGKELLIKEG